MAGLSLDEFVEGIHIEVEKFKEDYLKKREEHIARGIGEYFPLELEEDNAGLWYEFFFSYSQGEE